MRKKLISLIASMCMIISMLPVTAMAAGEYRPNKLYVGNTIITQKSYPGNTAYWTSNDGGTTWNSQTDKPTSDSYVHYDGNGTLTLHNAKIQGKYDSSIGNFGEGIYATSRSEAVSLHIVLEGKNTVYGSYGVFVLSEYGDALLSISGSGSLIAEGTGGGGCSGITVQSNNGKAELTINNVDVTATNNYEQGIKLHSADSSPATLTVNGGKLIASGKYAGIKYVFGSSSGNGTPSLTVADNAVVRANGGIIDYSSSEIKIGADNSGGSNGGIVFNGKNGTVYGKVELKENLKIDEDEILIIGKDASLTVPEGKTLMNNGIIKTDGSGKLINNGKIDNSGTLPENIDGSKPPKITTSILPKGKVGIDYSYDLKHEGDIISWNITDSILPTGLSLSNAGTISGTPTNAGTYSFTVKAVNNTGSSDSRKFTIEINEKSGGGGTVIPPSPIHTEIIGKDRYETAALIADEIGYYDTAVLVNAENTMSDGLSASALSGKYNAPILLTKKDSIPDSTMKRLKKASTIYIIGGENAISENVEKELSGKKVIRIGGSNRYETSELIAEHIGNYDRAFIVNGLEGEADAMSASAVSSKYNAPIILTNGKNSDYDPKSDTKYYAIGGENVLSDSIVSEYNAERISGDDRYETNREVIEKFYSSSSKYYFTNGNTLVDALSASLPAKNYGIVLVSSKSDNSVLEDKNTVQVGGMDFEISAK